MMCESEAGGTPEDEAVNPKHALFGEPIIGNEGVLWDEKGPGAIPAIPMPSPKGMTPAAWARHCITHLPYHPAVLIAWQLAVLTVNTVLPTIQSVPYPFGWGRLLCQWHQR